MLAMGLGFQVPVAILGAVRLEIVSVEKLRKNRRYAVLGAAVLAMLLPTVDPVSMLIETARSTSSTAQHRLARVFGGRAADVEGSVASAELMLRLRTACSSTCAEGAAGLVQATYLTLALS